MPSKLSVNTAWLAGSFSKITLMVVVVVSDCPSPDAPLSDTAMRIVVSSLLGLMKNKVDRRSLSVLISAVTSIDVSASS